MPFPSITLNAAYQKSYTLFFCAIRNVFLFSICARGRGKNCKRSFSLTQFFLKFYCRSTWGADLHDIILGSTQFCISMENQKLERVMRVGTLISTLLNLFILHEFLISQIKMLSLLLTSSIDTIRICAEPLHVKQESRNLRFQILTKGATFCLLFSMVVNRQHVCVVNLHFIQLPCTLTCKTSRW